MGNWRWFVNNNFTFSSRLTFWSRKSIKVRVELDRSDIRRKQEEEEEENNMDPPEEPSLKSGTAD